MDIATTYLNDILSASKLSQQDQIAQLTRLLSLNPQVNPYIVQLNSSNQTINTNKINIDNYNIYNNEWLAFNELLLSFIKLGNQLDPWSSLESFDLYTTYLNDLSIAFNNNNRGFLLSYLVRDAIDVILPMSIKLDFQLYFKEFRARPRLTYLASILLKIFNNIRSQINDTNQLKKTIILHVSNKLCLVYFKLENPLLCRNIFSNMNNANLNFKTFAKLEQVQYRYYLSRFYLMKDQLTDSYSHLLWCLLNCPTTGTVKNLEKILKLFLPVSLVLGRVPNFAYIRSVAGSSPMIEMYAKLSYSIRKGNFQGFAEVIEENYTVLKDSNLLLLLVNKSKILLLRNLIRKVWNINGQASSLDYDTIGAAIRFSLGNTSTNHIFPLVQNPYDINDYLIENVFVSLIDHDLLKGAIFPRLRKVALSKTNAFSNVADVIFTRFGSNSKADSWMNV